jgi:hypothetical protein
MAAVTQTIPSLIYGISQQPDELLLPGQLKDAKNVFLDVTTGLQKRPGAQLVGGAISNDSTGRWFAIDRDATEQYVGRIKTNGEVEIWSALDGTPRVVRYQALPYKDDNAIRQSFISSILAANTLSKPIAPACSASSFKTAMEAYVTAKAAADAKLQEIDAAEQALADKIDELSCEEIWNYKDNTSNNPYEQGNSIKITGVVVSDGVSTEFNKPSANANQTVVQGSFIKDVQYYKPTSYTSSGSTLTRNQLTTGKLYAWRRCYSSAYIASQTSALQSSITTLESQYPALQTAAASAYTTYSTEASKCGIYLDPYTQVAGTDPYIFLTVDPSAVYEDGTPNIIYKFQRLGTTTGATTVYYTVGGTATINVDYTISGDGTVSPTAVNRVVNFSAGETEKLVTVNPTTDASFEDNETITFQLKSDNTYTTATSIPVYSGIYDDEKIASTGILSYFKHQDPDDLRVLTINDFTFVANKNSLVGPGPVSMSRSDLTARPYEAFIEVLQIAYGKQYALNLNYYSTSQTSTKVYSAQSINVVTTDWTSTDGACPFVGSNVYDVNPSTGSVYPDADWIETVDGHSYAKIGGVWTKKNPASPALTRQNLRFELVTTGQSIPNSYKNAALGYYCRYISEATLEIGGEGWQKGDRVQVTMNGKAYEIVIGASKITEVYASAGLIRPTATSTTSTTVLKAYDILTDIKTAIDSTTTGFTTEIIGNGIYLSHTKPFTISTAEAQLLNVFTDQLNNITRLPTQCKDGYIVKVVNSSEQEDDYYLKFSVKTGSNLNSSTTINQTGVATTTGSVRVSGEGVWEETYQPGVSTKLNSATMPHQIVRTPDGSFVVSPVEWEDRLIGDDITNPVPSFVGRYIQGMTLFRNRFVLFSDENVIMSRPGDYFNFFAKTALTATSSDPIDIAVGSTKPASLRAAYSAKVGLVIFGDTEQYLIYTDNDILGPETARITTMSNYKFNSRTSPVGLGTSIAFLADTGKNTAMYEITKIPTNAEAEIIEQSKIISSLLPDGIDQIISTKDYSSLFLGTTGSNELWVFRYFESGERRVQGAWFRWELTGTLLHHAMLIDGYYVVLKNIDSITGKDIITIQKFDLKTQEWSAFVQNSNAYNFNVHLDSSKIIYSNQMTYSSVTDTTSFYVPFGYYSTNELVAYSLSEGEYAGLAAKPTVQYLPDDSNGLKLVLDGDWTTTRLLVGYTFEMSVKLPTIYKQTPTQQGVNSDTRSSLILHRIKINFGDSGIYATTLQRLGHDDYTEEYAVPLYDQYVADTVALKEKYIQTVPIYSRNTDTSISITSTHPSPATIYSVTWEGDLNNRYYTRV